MSSKRGRDSIDSLGPSKRGKWSMWPFGSAREALPLIHLKTLAETIKSSKVGQFQTALKPILKDLGLESQKELPKIVFCGQESSGKSSTVERAANLPFTPRNDNICTRQPLYLECKHLEEEGPMDSLVLDTPSGPQNIPMDSIGGGTLAKKVKEFMFDGPGIDEIPIKMTFSSRKVPTMSFCDLPGTIGVVKVGEPIDMKERTVELLKETIEDPHALIVSVVTQDVRNNIALETLQKTKGALQRTIVVLAKADMFEDASFKSKGKSNPYWMLEEMLISNPIQGYEGKIYPVVNRDTNSDEILSLAQVNANEQTWFAKNLPAYNRESQCSINAVINAIDNMYSKHMREVWLPDIMAIIAVKKSTVESHIRDLGIEPGSINRDAMYQWFSNTLNNKITSVIDRHYSMPPHDQSQVASLLKECIGTNTTVDVNPSCNMFLITKTRIDMFNRLRASIRKFSELHYMRYEKAFDESFDEYHYDYKISRFTILKRRCRQKFRLVLKRAVKCYVVEMEKFLVYFETSRISQPELRINDVYGAELHISVRSFAIPMKIWMLDLQSLRNEMVQGDRLIENCCDARIAFNGRITAFDKATSQLILLRTI